MVDSLNKKYDFIGMSKEKVYSILGDPNKNVCEYDYEENNKICYSINSDYMSNDFYCLSFDNYNLVLKIEKVSVK